MSSAAEPILSQGAGWAVVIGLGVWFVFARYLHPLLIGVAAWPGQA